jgi:predicted  nucleic acid-binding Zn-ribbon protein
MHEELFVIRDLNRIDIDIKQAQAEIAGMIAAVRASTDAVTAQKVSIAESEAALAAARDAERVLNRRMEEYVIRRDRTKKLIDEGRAPDFLSARRQLEQCSVIVDDLEVEVLEHMEQREDMEARMVNLIEQLARTREEDLAGRSRYAEAAPGLKAEIAELNTKRPALLERLNPDHRRVYGDHHRMGRESMTHLVGKVCQACSREAPAQVVMEVEHGKRIHRCRGCDRFFFSVIHPSLEESG